MTKVTEILAKFVVETNDDDIPHEVRHEAIRCLINLIAVAIHGSRDSSLQIWLDLFDEEGGAPRASVIGRDIRTSLQNAALANGYLGHLEDFDDSHFPTIMHGSAPIYPAVLALAEDMKLNGKSLLTAFVLGFEVAARIGLAMHPAQQYHSWHTTAIMGAFGAAIAAGKLLGLNVQSMVYAMGTAGTQAAGLIEVVGTLGKPFHAGRASQSGLLASLLSSKGFTSSHRILEGKAGFYQMFNGGKFDEECLTHGLGATWELNNNGLKPFACGVGFHPCVDAAIQLNHEGIRIEDVASILLVVHPLVPRPSAWLTDRKHPQTALEGKFSIEHCVATALSDGISSPNQFTEDKVNDVEIRNLRSKVHVTVDQTFHEDQAVVTICLKDGTRIKRYIEHGLGSPMNPVTDAQLEIKFRTLVESLLSSSQVDILLKMLWEIERIEDVSTIAALWKPG